MRHPIPTVLLLTAAVLAHVRSVDAQPVLVPLQVVTTGAGLCLDIRGGALAAGTPVQAYPCNGTASQAWHPARFGLFSLPPAQFTITTQNFAAVLTPRGPDEPWTLQGENLTNGSACLGLGSGQGSSQLVEQSCTASTTAWTASPIVANLHGDLSSMIANIPMEFWTSRLNNKMVVTVAGGLLQQNNTVFSSQIPRNGKVQSLLPATIKPNCYIEFPSPHPVWGAWYTTFYAITADGTIYMVNACGKDPILPVTNVQVYLTAENQMMNHAALALNAVVIGAGEVDVVNGRIVYIDNCSGHYTPTTYSLLFVSNWLAGQGAQGLPTHGLRLTQLRKMDTGSGIAANVRAGTGDCWSYVPPSS